jgi:glycosyltransferase involved in cell wall biosynthesis
MISGSLQGHAGGVERQTSLMARWLASRGHKVSLVTWDEGQDEIVIIDGVRIIKMCSVNAGIPGLRFFYPRWISLNKALRKGNADLYYHNCAEYITGQIALWCRLTRKKFVYSVANDMECEPSLPEMRTFRERLLYRYGLRKADKIIVQTLKQQRMLMEGFGLSSEVFPMPCQMAVSNDYYPRQPLKRENLRVLWVGRIDRPKRLEWLLEVARELPEVAFDVVGKPTYPDDPYSRQVFDQAKSLQNVVMHGMISHNQISSMYARAFLLCCTSIYEGFPNTFIEAWSTGLPIVTTFDPDDIILSKQLGIYAKNTSELVKGINTLLQDYVLWQQISANARQYYLERHTVDQAMLRFEKLFENTLTGISGKE